MKALLILDKYTDCNRNSMLSTPYLAIYQPATTVAGLEIHTIFYDEAEDYITKINEACENFKPDTIVYSHYPYKPVNIVRVRKNYGIPTFGIVWDSISDENIKQAKMLESLCDCVIVMDNPDYEKIAKKPGRVLFTTHPHSQQYFQPINVEKDIDISFVGSIREDRFSILKNLDNNLNVLISDRKRDGLKPIETYANILQRSKIALNFPWACDNIPHRKGRVSEVLMCGTVLAEPQCSFTEKFLKPMVDYIAFNNINELVTYVNDSTLLTTIQKNGYTKLPAIASPNTFWNDIENKLKDIK
jgi:hypothetical protein